MGGAILAAWLLLVDREAARAEPGAGFQLELSARPGGEIEVRLRNVGAPARLVSKRFAYANRTNPVAELWFEGDPPAATGCRFNVRPATASDLVLLGPGEFVGRVLSGEALSCFVGKADTVRLTARYRVKTAAKGPVLEGELKSNEISVSRQELTLP